MGTAEEASTMSVRNWLRTARARRGLAASVIVLAAGGLILARSPAVAHVPGIGSAVASGTNSAPFRGPGAHGTVALSHGKVLAGSEQRIFSEITFVADPAQGQALERAPLSLVVVIDTSGSMAGEKIDQAKDSVVQLLCDMRDDDEIALVRYASDSEVLQPLARIGQVREELIAKVRRISSGGGTNIPPALSDGIRSLADAGRGRVRRVVLVSDGLDSTRSQAESIARESAARGVTTSSLGIGLDFDESYMGGVARAGRGNFGFVKDASALATFLGRELKETAQTTIAGASIRIQLPAGVRLVQAHGADVKLGSGGRDAELITGPLFAGDERRIIVELAASLDAGEVTGLDGLVTWSLVGGQQAEATFGRLMLQGTADAQEVAAARDGSVFAEATSTFSSARQIAAAEAYQKGDIAKAEALVDDNLRELQAAAAVAPAAAATALEQQQSEYKSTRAQFRAAPPTTEPGKAAAKESVAKDIANMDRSRW
jgi:Ca-activated chloride channel homolog